MKNLVEENVKLPWPHAEYGSGPLSFPTPLVHLLKHNHPPSDQEASRVIDFKEAVQRRILTETEDNTRRLQEELKDSQIGLKKQLFACDVILSPFRRLPSDVIHEIVAQCPTVQPSYACTNPKFHLPSVLAQTSRVWRDAVRGTSRLWQDLHFAFEDWGTGADYIMDRLELFSQLSCSLPLSLRLDKRSFDNETFDWNQVSFLQGFLSIWQNRNRITRVCLNGVDPAIVAQKWQVGVDALPTHPTPAVKSILFLEEDHRVYGRRGLQSETVTKLINLLPKLKHLWLGYRVSDLETIVPAPTGSLQSWSRLKTLYMGTGFSTFDWRVLLQACPNLEAAFFHIHDFDRTSQYRTSPSSPTSHHHLKELVIRFTAYDYSILAPFCGVELPNVHTLDVTFAVCKLLYPKLPRSYERHLCSTFPSLKTLAIHRAGDIANTINSVFPFLLAFGSTVTSLRVSLSFHHIHPVLFFLCGWSSNTHERPLPHLQNLVVEFPLESTHWNRTLPKQLTPLFVYVQESLRPPANRILAEWYALNSDQLTPPNLQSMAIHLNIPPRLNKTKANREILRYFSGLQKEFHSNRAAIQVELYVLPDEPFESYERRFMDHFAA